MRRRFPNEPEYLQAVEEVVTSIEDVYNEHPEFERYNLIERLCLPDRIISFRVSWVDDKGQVHNNMGYRIQHNNAIGPYKGGIRFHASVNQSILKFLAFEQTFKNSNTVMVALPKILKKGFISYKEEARVAQEYVKRLHTATPSINQKTMFLSGGNQQKVVLAKWLYSDSDIIIFDEPTRGIDVGARREIYEIINNLVENGKTVVVISSDMEEIMGVSDRILVMYEGTIAGEIQKKDFTQDLITKYAVGEKRSVQA